MNSKEKQTSTYHILKLSINCQLPLESEVAGVVLQFLDLLTLLPRTSQDGWVGIKSPIFVTMPYCVER